MTETLMHLTTVRLNACRGPPMGARSCMRLTQLSKMLRYHMLGSMLPKQHVCRHASLVPQSRCHTSRADC